MFVIHLNDQNLKILLLQILLIKMILFYWVAYLFSLLPVGKIRAYIDRFYCQSSDFRVTLGANFLVKVQNTKFAYFFLFQKLRFYGY